MSLVIVSGGAGIWRVKDAVSQRALLGVGVIHNLEPQHHEVTPMGRVILREDKEDD